MTRFFLIRHAEKAVDGQVLTGHAPNIHLSEHGQWQAEWLADRLEREQIDRIVCSPLERTRETALPLARRKGIEIEVAEQIIEFDVGEWTLKQVPDLEPDMRWQHFNTFRSGTRPPGGELMLEVQQRFVSEMLRLRDTFPGETIALFSHGDPIKAALMYFTGTPIDYFLRFEIDVASITSIVLHDWGPRIQFVNETYRE